MANFSEPLMCMNIFGAKNAKSFAKSKEFNRHKLKHVLEILLLTKKVQAAETAAFGVSNQSKDFQY